MIERLVVELGLAVLVIDVCINNVTANSKDVVYRYISIDGQPDLELLQGADPCVSIKCHCSRFYTSPLQYDSCFDTLHGRISMQLGYHWSLVRKKLKVNENLFIDCSKYEMDLAEQSNITRAAKYMDELAISTTAYNLTHRNSSDLIIQQLLNYAEVLIKNGSFGEKEIAFFDARINELNLTNFHKFELYRQALLKFPANLYMVSQFGLALMSLGFEEDARLLFRNGVARGLWGNPLQRPVFKYVRGLTSKPWHNKNDFIFTTKLEDGAKQIRSELIYNLENHPYLFMQNYGYMPVCGNWKVIKLISNDGQQTKYVDYFPKTMKIIDNSEQKFIAITFSAIKPGTHIAAHTGPSNDQLRVHLSLVHMGGARIRVGTEWRSWEEGKVFIFDSSWEHEVVHNGNDTRIVLILDIWHPDLPLKDQIL